MPRGTRVAVALRATMESENASSIHRRTECDGYRFAISMPCGAHGREGTVIYFVVRNLPAILKGWQ